MTRLCLSAVLKTNTSGRHGTFATADGSRTGPATGTPPFVTRTSRRLMPLRIAPHSNNLSPQRRRIFMHGPMPIAHRLYDLRFIPNHRRANSSQGVLRATLRANGSLRSVVAKTAPRMIPGREAWDADRGITAVCRVNLSRPTGQIGGRFSQLFVDGACHETNRPPVARSISRGHRCRGYRNHASKALASLVGLLPFISLVRQAPLRLAPVPTPLRRLFTAGRPAMKRGEC